MTLSEWMSENALDDDKVGAMAGADRVTISRIRRGINKPSWDLAARIKSISGGQVSADDFLPEAAE